MGMALGGFEDSVVSGALEEVGYMGGKGTKHSDCRCNGCI